MPLTITGILKAERENLLACAEAFARRNAAKLDDNAAAALTCYARSIPQIFIAYSKSGDRKSMRRKLTKCAERLADARVPPSLAERFAAVFHRFLRDLIYRGFGENRRALRRILAWKDNFFEDLLGRYPRDLVRREESRIRETEKRHADFFAHAIFPAFLATGAGKILKVNPAFLDHFGGSSETLEGKSVAEMLSLIGVSPSAVRDYWRRLRKDGFVRDMTMTARCRKGRTAHLEISSIFTRSSRGRINDLLGMIHNVTAHVLPQLELEKTIETLKKHGAIAKRQNRTLKAVYESSPAGLMFVNPKNQISMMNQKTSEILGFCMLGEDSRAPLRSHFAAFATDLRSSADFLALAERVEREPTLRAGGMFEILVPPRFVQYQTLPVLDARKGYQGRLWVFLDVTRQIEDERIKEDLIHMIVHDLKNPLTALAAAGHVLHLQLREPSPQAVQTMEMIDRNASAMMRMITNLLNIHRFESHGLKPDCRPIALEPLARETMDSMRSLEKEREIRLAFPRKRPLPLVMADASLIGRVLSNLLSNAVKHTDPAAGKIRIAARDLRNGFVEVAVEDNGEGIPREYHARIFDKFQRVAGQKMGQRSDTGLGLAFCKLAVTAHGGEIGVKNAVGRGCRFFFTLPVETPREIGRG